jgi:hypothetical protein
LEVLQRIGDPPNNYLICGLICGRVEKGKMWGMEGGSFGDHLSLGSVVFFKVREGGREGGEGCCCTYDFIYVYSIYTMVV